MQDTNPRSPASLSPVTEGAEIIYLGAGCFWCTESVFQQISGVQSAVSGYMGGSVVSPTYEQICEGDTGHAEVTLIVFDPKTIPLNALLDIFWKMHDPTTPNRQGNDVGTQYRSAIYYVDESQRQVVETSIQDAAARFSSPIVTEVTPASQFYPAENYHQDYYRLNKSKNPYCHYVITPKLQKLGLQS